jgi:hypothetical protein
MAPNTPVNKSSKVIFVTVIDGEVNTEYDVILQKRNPDKNETNEKIDDVLQRKSKALKNVFLSCERALKDRSEVRCVVKKPKFDFSSVEDIDQLSGIPDEEPNCSIVRHSTALLGDAPSLNQKKTLLKTVISSYKHYKLLRNKYNHQK